jgi:DMSO/TMAO reductase YedYZ molybdopterin-dependent catalytic subunit
MKLADRRPLWPYAACGLLAAAAGMAAGHLLAAWIAPSASPVLAVGSTVIDATPTPVKEWAVQQLGTSDKPVLLASVALVTAVAAAAIGLASARRPRTAATLLVVLAALAGAAALARPSAMPADALPAVAAALVGVATLVGLRRLLPRAGAPESATHDSPLDHTAYAAGAAGAPPRRTFLLGAVGVTAGAAAVGALGQQLSTCSTAPFSVSLPPPTNTPPALPAGIEGTVEGVSPFRTPLKDFYRVDTALVLPRVDTSSWRLVVDGDVDHPFSLSFADLLALPMVEKDITLNCVSNPVGGPYVSSARWLGVHVRDLLERAGVRSGVDQVLSTSTDGMTISTPITALTDDRDAMVVVGIDGQPLPAERGFPARLLTPGLYGYVGATKWLTRLRATTYAEREAYWTKRGWAARAEVKTQSRIDTPRGLATYQPGPLAIGGVAWAQGRGIESVEVRVDDGPWHRATLGPDGGTDYWRQWYWMWPATKGRHDLTVRATDGTGTVQTDRRAEPFPSGASGYHTVVVTIA